MRRKTWLYAGIGLTTLAIATPAAADVVADWNVCAPTIIAAGRATFQFGTGPGTQLDLAVVHLAMHDAIQAYDQRYHPYAGAIAAGEGSAIAAAARAAHTVLVTKFGPQAAIDGCYTTSMTGVVLSPAELADSNTVGNAAAAHVLAARDGDGSFPSGPITPFTGGTAPGDWRPNTGTASMVAPWLGDVRPFAIGSVDRCQPSDPPALTSAEYAEAYNEVQGIGAVNSPRTAEQGHIARTYSGNFGGQFNRLMRELAAAYIGGTDLASLGDRARLFALANTAASDALICSWNAKKAFNLWRPQPAIRNGDADGNILTDEDTAWTSYMAAPNYPDYTSGGNNFGGSVTRMLELFFGGDKPFETPFRIYAIGGAVPLLPTDALFREYSKFSDIAKEIIDARIYLGIHFRFADTEARSQGRRVANHTFKNILQPVAR